MSISIEVDGFNNYDIFIAKCEYFDRASRIFVGEGVAKILAGESGQVTKVGCTAGNVKVALAEAGIELVPPFPPRSPDLSLPRACGHS